MQILEYVCLETASGAKDVSIKMPTEHIWRFWDDVAFQRALQTLKSFADS